MRERNDGDLREAFQNLRNEDRGEVPEFKRLWERAREEASRSGTGFPEGVRTRRSLSRWLPWGGGILAAAAAAGLLLMRPPATSDSEFVQVVQAFSTDPAGGAWRSPTDALLELPGENVLSTVPSIETPRWLPELGSGPSRNEP